jgi:hypothetical protein
MTVREVIDILKECDQDRNVYIKDDDGTAQIVTVIGDLRHVNVDMPGVKIPDDVYFMTSRQFEEFGEDDGMEELPKDVQV